ncbi:hypothetical protein GCM10011391_19400 [Pullulanibacillus camelliae]|uniref:Uncharacterized protein n=1 Tax=Pullulanibacillus camelliae TaxID=1707096 RepID=A0A8J2VSX9_9BACL|nr:hypothetical protein [Pullulanibacillus camelliae]GGE40730.1 hypothetical protein GCM10011391_19400 [Pullulanibacillus camelliae]
MAKNNKDVVQHGVNAAKEKATDNEEKQYVEELASELSSSTQMTKATNKKQ